MFNKVLLTCFIKNINININSLLILVYQNRLSSISSFCTVRVYLYTYFKTTAIFITKTLSTRRFSGWVAECLCMYVYIEDITRWREDMNFMFEWQEHKIHIFEPTCNVLFITWRNQFNKSKRRENTPLGSRMKWRMESTSGLVPSKTLFSI